MDQKRFAADLAQFSQLEQLANLNTKMDKSQKNDPAENNGDNEMWIDDCYINKRWSRVEIGDNAVYNSCTHREIQDVTAWTDTDITITLNQGSFSAFNNQYIFFVFICFFFI